MNAFGVSGLGSIDIVNEIGPPPAALARIYNDLGNSTGTLGFTTSEVLVEDLYEQLRSSFPVAADLTA